MLAVAVLISAILLLVVLAGSTLLVRIAPDLANKGHGLLLTAALGIWFFGPGLPISLELAYEYGFGYLAFPLGMSGLFMLAPLLLYPLHRLVRANQLNSLADLAAFRYRSQAGGAVICLVSVGAVTLLATSLVGLYAETLPLLEQGPSSWRHLLVLGVMTGVISIVTRWHKRPDDKWRVPVQTLFGLQGILALGILVLYALFLLYSHFGGFSGLEDWIREDAMRISSRERHLPEGPWRALLLLYFAAAFLMPPMYHLLFADNPEPTLLFRASWAFPAFLLIAASAIPVFLWAGIRAGMPSQPELLPLGLALRSELQWLPIVVHAVLLISSASFIALSAASVVGMIMNHLVLPLHQPQDTSNIYAWLNLRRSGLWLILLVAPFAATQFIDPHLNTLDLSILSLSLIAQCLPAILALLYWPQGNRSGLLAGLGAGLALWVVLLALPWLHPQTLEPLTSALGWQPTPASQWHWYVLISLLANTCMFAIVSLSSEAAPDELAAARTCRADLPHEASSHGIGVKSRSQLQERLQQAIGPAAAARELELAAHQIGVTSGDNRPVTLFRLRNRLESNLSGLLGPSVARSIMRRSLDRAPESGTGRDLPWAESRLEDYHTRLSGLAAELDQLRRYHRQVLQQLPLAACSISAGRDLLMWNEAMATLTEIDEDEIIGAPVSTVPQPWRRILLKACEDPQTHRASEQVLVAGEPRWFNLHKAVLEGEGAGGAGQVVLIEDTTERQRLQNELVHSERLASIGRLAAGVAHEIGNPVTGIACLAQNLKLHTQDRIILETAEQVYEQTQRISRILQSLMNFARESGPTIIRSTSVVPVQHCVSEAIHLLQLSPGTRAVQYVNEVAENALTRGDSQRLIQVFINLLSNARDASGNHATVRITSELSPEELRISVLDEGTGIAPEYRHRLFEPFFTTKGPNEGTGLGLTLVYGIIEEHAGRIVIDSPVRPDGRGTAVRVILPRVLDVQPAALSQES